jgi:hypothetical protein
VKKGMFRPRRNQRVPIGMADRIYPLNFPAGWTVRFQKQIF